MRAKEGPAPEELERKIKRTMSDIATLYRHLFSSKSVPIQLGVPRTDDEDDDDIVIYIDFVENGATVIMTIGFIDETLTHEEIFDCLERTRRELARDMFSQFNKVTIH